MKIFNGNSIKDHLIYKIDNSISRGTGSIILWLAIFLSLTVMVMAFLVWFSEASPEKSFTSGLSEKLTKIREGHSKITETGHVVILGCS